MCWRAVENIHQYYNSFNGMNNRIQALEVFRRGSAVLEGALLGATSEETVFVTGPGKWTIRHLVRHLADTEIVVGMRMRQIIAEDQPTLVPFDHDAWASKLRYEEADPFDSLARFRSLREDTSRVLDAYQKRRSSGWACTRSAV